MSKADGLKFQLLKLNSSGKVVAELSKGYYTKAAVLLHPSRVTLDDIKGTASLTQFTVEKTLTFKNIETLGKTDKGFEDAKRVIAALKNKGVSGIGAVGFCWGGKVVAELSKGYYTKAAVLLHPSRVTLDDIKEIKTPIAILAAQFDNSTAPELVKQFKEVLSTNKIDNFVKIFPGVSHGWTVRYKDDNVTAVKSANEAHQDMLDWFTKYVQKT
ncbi:uncharacterized protein LOC133716350 [Rosa rugosa]|uniref:uncharacterized protein LOC133716350 n=1 Tax=Rosa rugosa TaxID=74645 RepID=UPI002B404D45|nr:uncharacterized protein LOC133716350 [Rosa rugosa]